MRKPIVLSKFRLSEVDRRTQRVLYVSQAKGDGGKDWGWTTEADKAGVFSFAVARRFMADRSACGSTTAQTFEVAK
jgi:hypothetical protein